MDEAGSGEPVLCPIARMVVIVFSARPPKVSATRRINSIPAERQEMGSQLAANSNLKCVARSGSSFCYCLLLERGEMT